MKGKHWAIIAIVVVAVIAIGTYALTATTAQLNLAEEQPNPDEVLVESVYLDKPGYVVVHSLDDGGELGPVIGASGLISGPMTNFTIPLAGNFTGNATDINVTAIGKAVALQYDNGDGVFNPLQDTKRAALAGNTTVYTINASGNVSGEF